MTHDPEAAWPLTTPEAGYYGVTPPRADPPASLPPSNIAPYDPPAADRYSRHGRRAGRDPGQRGPDTPTPYWFRLASLAIILGTAIPLTAIAGSYYALPGMAVVWVGIVIVAAVALGRTR